MKAVQWSVELNEQQRKEKQQLAAQLKQHPQVRQFLSENQLDERWVDDYPYRFRQWIDQLTLCQGCGGLEQCRRGP